MIKATELRIGNYTHKKDATIDAAGKVNYSYRLHVIDHNDIYHIVEDGDPTNHPIPLTPEWLERCGEKCINNNGWEYQIRIGALKWYFRWNKEWYSELGGIYIDSKVKYIHQLQNLYFALTGVELTIKETV